MDRFNNGELPVIVNCGILTIGYDNENVTALIFARPTKSKILYVQCLGRGLRTSESKSNCLIIDVVDIVRKHDLMTMTDIFGVEIKDQETLTEAIEREEKNKAEKLEREVRNNKKIKIIAKHIPDNELQIYFKSANLIIAPYEQALNSGVLFLALTFNKPILLPATTNSILSPRSSLRMFFSLSLITAPVKLVCGSKDSSLEESASADSYLLICIFSALEGKYKTTTFFS